MGQNKSDVDLIPPVAAIPAPETLPEETSVEKTDTVPEARARAGSGNDHRIKFAVIV